MPVSKPSLQPTQKIFTKQDFLDGKCTKEGLPTGTQVIDEKPLAPEQPVAPEPIEETVIEETPNGDSPDSEESPDDSDGGDSSGEEADKEAA